MIFVCYNVSVGKTGEYNVKKYKGFLIIAEKDSVVVYNKGIEICVCNTIEDAMQTIDHAILSAIIDHNSSVQNWSKQNEN